MCWASIRRIMSGMVSTAPCEWKLLSPPEVSACTLRGSAAITHLLSKAAHYLFRAESGCRAFVDSVSGNASDQDFSRDAKVLGGASLVPVEFLQRLQDHLALDRTESRTFR